MLNLIYKTKQIILRSSLLAIALCLSSLALWPATGQATSPTSQQYALACVAGGHVTVKGNSVSCKGGPDVVSVQGIGGPGQSAQPYPDSTELTVVQVDCNKNKPKDPQLGATVDHFSCTKGAPTSVKKLKVIAASSNPTINVFGTNGQNQTIQNGQTLGSGIANCATNEGTCASCYSADKSNCIDCSKVACSDSAVNCSSGGCDLVATYLQPIITVLSGTVGLVVVLSLIIGGVQYSASEGDPQKVSKAKNRISNTIFAFIAYMFLYAFLQFLVPGGIFNR
jgi:hypothetical protein